MEHPNDKDSIDQRSSLVKGGKVQFTKEGKIDQRSSAVRSGEVLVTQDGSLDMRSSAVKQETVYLKESTTPAERRKFTNAEIDAAWEKGAPIPGKDSDLYRKDKVDNVIYKRSYGKQTEMGWDVDHSKPLSKGGTYHPNNLQPMQSSQNRADKGATYPYNYQDAIPKGVTPRDIAPTEIDKRSSLVHNGGLMFNADGSVDCRSSAVIKGDVLVTKEGSVDKRSAAYKRGDVTLKPSEASASSVDQVADQVASLSLGDDSSASAKAASPTRASASRTGTPNSSGSARPYHRDATGRFTSAPSASTSSSPPPHSSANTHGPAYPSPSTSSYSSSYSSSSGSSYSPSSAPSYPTPSYSSWYSPSTTSYSSGGGYSSSSSSSYSSRAPAGGTTVGGTFYKGGQFIPKS